MPPRLVQETCTGSDAAGRSALIDIMSTSAGCRRSSMGTVMVCKSWFEMVWYENMMWRLSSRTKSTKCVRCADQSLTSLQVKSRGISLVWQGMPVVLGLWFYRPLDYWVGVPCGLNGGWRSFQCAWLGIQGLGALFHCGMWNLAIQRGGRATMRDVGKFWTHQNVGNSKQKTVRFSMSSIQFGMMYFRCAAHRHARNLAGKIHWFYRKSWFHQSRWEALFDMEKLPSEALLSIERIWTI